MNKLFENFRRFICEAITLDIEIGDVVLMGKFRNKRVVVKKIGKDEKGQPTINGRPILNLRIEKELPDDMKSKQTKEEEKDKEVAYEGVGPLQTIEPIDPLANNNETPIKGYVDAEDIIDVTEEDQPNDAEDIIAGINAAYKGTPAELKPKVLELLPEGWRSASKEQLEEYYNKICDLLI